MEYGVRIGGLGMSVPDEVVTNERMKMILHERRQARLASGETLTAEQMEEYETSDEWIIDRTGIRERRFAPPHMATSDYLRQAADEAWTDAYGDGLETPDFVEVATVSPDFFRTPSTAAVAHRKWGIPVYVGSPDQKRLRRFFSADSCQACTSYVMGAFRYGCLNIVSGLCERGLACGADIMSRTSNPHKRSPYVILADGAGAIALERTPVEKTWIPINGFHGGVNGGKNGALENIIKVVAGGTAVPFNQSHLHPDCDDLWIVMEGRKVFTKIVPMVADEIIPSACEHAQVPVEKIDVIIFHQANQRMTEAICRWMMEKNPRIAFRIATWDCPEGIPIFPKNESGPRTGCHEIIVYCNIDRFGNTTSASVPMAICEARKLDIIRDGVLVLTVAMGGGFSWGSAFIYWGGIDLPAFAWAA